MKKLKLLWGVLAMLLIPNVSSADTSVLVNSDGWEKMTSITDEDIKSKFFVFVANEADLVLRLETSSTQGTKAMFFRPLSAENVFKDKAVVWRIEKSGTVSGIRCVGDYPLMMQTEWSGSSNDIRWRTNDQSIPVSWTGFGWAYADGAWTLTSTQYSRPLGIYNNATGTPVDGNEVGANDAGNGQKFQIYGIDIDTYSSKYRSVNVTGLDLSSLITNSGFDKSNTVYTDRGWTVPAKVEGNYTFNGAVEYWHYVPALDFNQTITNLPIGCYTVSVQADQTGNTCVLYAEGMKRVSVAIGVQLVSGDFNGKRDAFAANEETGKASLTAYVTNGQLKIGLNDPSSSTNWCVFDNFRLTSVTATAEMFNEVYAFAESKVESSDYVTATEKTALETLISTYSTTPSDFDAATKELLKAIANYSASTATKAELDALIEEAKAKSTEVMNATVKSNLTTKISELETATYSTTAEIETAIEELKSQMPAVQTSIDNYAKLKKAIEAAEVFIVENTFATSDAITAYKNKITEAKAGYNDASYTDSGIATVITELSMGITGWQGDSGMGGALLASAWDFTVNSWDGSAYVNSWSTEGETDGSNFKVPFVEAFIAYENVLSARTMTGTLSGLDPNRTYRVEIWSRIAKTKDKKVVANTVTMQVGTGDAVDIAQGSQVGSSNLYLGKFTADGSSDASGNLIVTINIAEGSNVHWFTFKNVTYSPLASEAEINALKSAISEAEGKALGFEAGEYAPYNNVEVLTTLKEAKSLDLSVSQAASTITDLTSRLTTATWTANEAEVNAIYDGTFKIHAEDTASPVEEMPGWTPITDVLRQIVKNTSSYPSLNGADDKAALYVWPCTIEYGTLDGYKMPLKAGQIYVAKAKYCSWSGDSNKSLTLTVKQGGNVVASQTFAGTDASALKSVEMVFKADVAGDYTLAVTASGNTLMTDFYVLKATASDLTIDEAAGYTPAAAYANVSLKRTFVTGWNGLVLPFDMTAEEAKTTFNATAVKNFDEVTDDGTNATLKFVDAENIKAGVPVLIKVTAPAESNSYALSNVWLPGTALQNVNKKSTNADFTFTGTYSATTDLQAVSFVLIQGDKLYSHEANSSATTAKSMRAYFANNTTEGAKSLNILFDLDGETTAITEVKNNSQTTQTYYDMQGRRILKPVKGLYIQNGKKVVIK